MDRNSGVLALSSFERTRLRLQALPFDAYGNLALLALVVAGAVAIPLLCVPAPGGTPIFWLANAVLLVAVLRARPESRNLVLAVGFFANVVARGAVGEPFPASATQASFDLLEVAGAAALVALRRGPRGSASGGNKLAEITFLSAGIAPAIGATLATAFAAGTTSGHPGFDWLQLYLRDGFGMVALVPFGLALEFNMIVALFRRSAVVQTLLILGALFCVDWLVFGTDVFPRLFVIVPLLVIAAFRLGIGGAALSFLLTAAVAAVASGHGHGVLSFWAGMSIDRLFGLQLFLAVGAWTMLPIAGVLREREALLAQLHERWAALAESHDVLEERNARVVDLIALKESISTALPSRSAVIHVILTFAQEQTNAVGAVMERVAGDDLVYEVATGTLSGAVGASVKRSGSLSGLCSTSNDVLSCTDVEQDDRIDKPACRRLNIRSMIVVPITIDAVVVGVLKVASDRTHGFTEHDVLNLKLAAGHLSSAMRAASSYDRMQVAEAEAQGTIENMTDGVVVFGAGGAVLRHNLASERILGLNKDELERWASASKQIVDVDDRPLAVEDRPVAYALRTGEAQRDVVVGVGRTGVDRRWISMSVVPVSFAAGPTTDRFILSVRDVTDLQQSELDYRANARRLSSLHLIASQVSHTGREQVDAALALCREELGLDWGYLGVLDETAAELVIESTVGLARDAGPQAVGNRLPVERTVVGRVLASSEVLAMSNLTTVLEADPSVVVNGRWGAYIAVPIKVNERVYGAIGFVGRTARVREFPTPDLDFVRITGDLIGSAIERRLQGERLDALAFADALTGLPNRLLFEDRLARTVLASKRYNERFAVLYIDLDRFKAVNDTYGHGTGDEVLRVVARRLESAVRESDTVARIGGDEFLVLAPKVRSSADAADLAWRIVEAMRIPIDIDGVVHEISASVGTSVYPDDGEADMMIKNADAALYRVKAAGKNAVGLARELTPVP